MDGLLYVDREHGGGWQERCGLLFSDRRLAGDARAGCCAAGVDVDCAWFGDLDDLEGGAADGALLQFRKKRCVSEQNPKSRATCSGPA